MSNPTLSSAKSAFLKLAHERGTWLTPRGPWWRVTDSLVETGFLEHNGRPRFGGEAYRITNAGRAAIGVPTLPVPHAASDDQWKQMGREMKADQAERDFNRQF